MHVGNEVDETNCYVMMIQKTYRCVTFETGFHFEACEGWENCVKLPDA